MSYILHLPSWTPTENEPFKGNFIERHISTISTIIPSVTLQLKKCNQKRKYEIDGKDAKNIIIKYYLFSNLRENFSLCRKLFFLLKSKNAIAKIVQKYGKPLAIHLHVAYPMGPIAIYIAQKYKIPLFLTEHWSIYEPRNRKNLNSFQWSVIKKVFSKIKSYSAVSQHLKSNISLLFSHAQGYVIPNVIDTTLFHPVANKPNYPKILLHISTLDEEAKNISGLLRAVHQLSKVRSDFVLWIIHEKKNKTAEKFVETHRLNRIIHFLGSKSIQEVSKIVQQSDFLVHFSNYETFGCVVAEALSSGKPVVTSNVPALLEIVNEKRGIVVPIQDEDALTRALETMLEQFHQYNPQELHQFVKEKYAPTVVASLFKQMYSDFLEKE